MTIGLSWSAASNQTLLFMLIVTALLLPVILIFTSYTYTYKVFRGKTCSKKPQKTENNPF